MNNIENKRDYWTYETKCCRCGFITEWVLGNKKIFSPQDFHNYKYLHISECPKTFADCKSCEKETVQEYVSFN